MPTLAVTMPRPLIVYGLLATFALSAGFVATAIYTYAWVTDIPKVGFNAAIRLFYMPHALAAAAVLDTLAPHRESALLSYSLAFLATLPVSLLYVLIARPIFVWVKRRLSVIGARGHSDG
jgi:hypothetical protein